MSCHSSQGNTYVHLCAYANGYEKYDISSVERPSCICICVMGTESKMVARIDGPCLMEDKAFFSIESSRIY